MSKFKKMYRDFFGLQEAVNVKSDQLNNPAEVKARVHQDLFVFDLDLLLTLIIYF